MRKKQVFQLYQEWYAHFRFSHACDIIIIAMSPPLHVLTFKCVCSIKCDGINLALPLILKVVFIDHDLLLQGREYSCTAVSHFEKFLKLSMWSSLVYKFQETCSLVPLIDVFNARCIRNKWKRKVLIVEGILDVDIYLESIFMISSRSSND